MPKYRAPSYDPAPLAALVPQPSTGTRAADPRDLNSDVELQNEREQSSFSLEYIWSINDSWTLTSLTNYQTFEKTPQADFDMTEEDFYLWSERFETEQRSEELRLNFEGDDIHGLIGLFYFNEEIDSVNQLDLALDPGPPRCTVADNVSPSLLNADVEDICFNFSGTSETEAYALFANVSIDLTQALTLNLGGRYSYEKREGDTDRWIVPGLVTPVTFSDEQSFNNFSPSARLEWHAAEDVTLYASYSQGFKSGIFLTGQTSPVLDPEVVDAYEVGLKGMFLDSRLRFNAAVFYYDYTDLQQGRSVPAGTSGFTLVYENAAEAEIKGAEAEVTWLATEWLQIDGSVTYLDATFGDYVTTDPFDTVYQQLGLIPAGEDLSQQLKGNRMVQSPEWAYSLGATVDFQVPGTDWSGTANVSAAYKDRVYFSQFNHKALSQEAVTTVNAYLNVTSPDERWSLNIWGKNLTDEEVYMGTFILNSSRTNAGFLAPPRTYGLTLGYNF
jgi:iron complex outermembrane receptor protein